MLLDLSIYVVAARDYGNIFVSSSERRGGERSKAGAIAALTSGSLQYISSCSN